MTLSPRRLSRWLPVACLLAQLGVPASAQTTISDGALSVVVHSNGLLQDAPPYGLATYGGPTHVFKGPVTEWYGVRYRINGALVEGVGEGSAADWAGRPPVVPISFERTPTSTRSVARCGDLRIETRFEFDDDGPYLLLAVDVTNLGTRTLDDIYYTREWLGVGAGWSFPPDFVALPAVGPSVRRSAWMLSDLSPGETDGIGLAFQRDPDAVAPLVAGVDVPLQLWTNASFPAGVPVGQTNGISFYDYDRDGFIDMFACQSGNLWRNLGGTDWVQTADLDSVLPNATYRYGAAFGDYDNDGLADIGTEPRNSGGDDCFHLLRNRGGANFRDVTNDPQQVPTVVCNAEAETLCWGDVDGDGDLDMFLPVYDIGASPGNYFLENDGPSAPGGAYRMLDTTASAQLGNPPWNNRAEGAQMVDVDRDGDLDIYSNGTLYQNRSTLGMPLFEQADVSGTGIQFSTLLDEGAAFWDHDMDGDQDIIVAFTSGSIGVRVFENLGDGNFSPLPANTVDSNTTGLSLGLSYADWDNDGDIDFTTRQVFRRNQLMETGTATYTVATKMIPSGHITSATPAWGDWDLDGDLDCALGNWLSVGHFYENCTYELDTPDADRRFVRVRVMRDSVDVEDGLETEFGATVEVRVQDDLPGLRRVQFVSSAGGYLNQSEYVLHFALPADPKPGVADDDLEFDVIVDFARGEGPEYVRVDAHVNPLLGGIQLAELDQREITVFRSGRVDFEGRRIDPQPGRSSLLSTTTDGLQLPVATALLADPIPAGLQDFVGIEFNTQAASGPLRLTEVILDGQLGTPINCSGASGNIVVWDVTGTPALVGSLDATTSARNNRSTFAVDFALEPNRTYRVIARVTELRSSPILAPAVNGALTTTGGLRFADTAGCTGIAAAAAPLNAALVPLSARVSEAVGEAFFELGQGLAGALGAPALSGTGAAQPGTPYTLDLAGAAPNSFAVLAIGNSAEFADLFGGTVVPALDRLIVGLNTGPAGAITIASSFPSLPPGASLYAQYAIVDPTAPQGVALSDALAVTTQP